MRLGLRIDVCTYQGLRRGVPTLLRLLDRRQLRASFFAALGPDTSGRAIFHLLRPGFLGKLRRTRAVRSYGLRTVLSGTLLRARRMAGEAGLLQAVLAGGHELALHGYDHRRWQDRLCDMAPAAVRAELALARSVYQEVTGAAPRAFGAPGWQCSEASLLAVEADRNDESPAMLRRKVTSPGGTTEAALRVFAEAGFEPLVRRALTAARDRSRELSG